MKMPIKPSIFTQERKTYLDKNCSEEVYLLDLAETNLENIDPSYIRKIIENFQWGYGYPGFHLYNEFIDKICNRYAYGINDKQVFLGHWSFNIIERILHKFLNLDYLVGYGPQFNEIPSDFEFTWGKYLSSNFDSDIMWLSEDLMAKTLKLCPSKSAIYIDNPNNPTGRFYMPDEIENIIIIAQKNEAIVIIDEAFWDYLPDEYSAMKFIAQYPNLIVVRSMSKFFWLSWLRIWYIATSAELSEYYRKIDVPYEPSVLSLHIWASIINDWKLISEIQNKSSIKKRKMVELLSDKNIEIVSTNMESPLLFIRKPTNHLLDRIKVIDWKHFDNTYQKSWQYMRLRIPNSEVSMQLFNELLIS